MLLGCCSDSLILVRRRSLLCYGPRHLPNFTWECRRGKARAEVGCSALLPTPGSPIHKKLRVGGSDSQTESKTVEDLLAGEDWRLIFFGQVPAHHHHLLSHENLRHKAEATDTTCIFQVGEERTLPLSTPPTSTSSPQIQSRCH